VQDLLGQYTATSDEFRAALLGLAVEGESDDDEEED